MQGIFTTGKEHQKRKKGFQKTVYLVGAGPGAGVTHTGILLAEFLEERRGARTLFLEMNNHKDIACIRKELLAADYESIGSSPVKELEIGSYDYIVVDAGTNLSFFKAGIPEGAKGVLVGNGAPWKRERFCQAVKGIQALLPEMEWSGLLSLGDKKEAKKLSAELEFPVSVLGWQPLYEPLSETSEDLFLSLIRGGKG